MPVRIRFEGREILADAGQTLLEALLSAGIRLPHACRSGVCQSCVLQCSGGDVPLRAQDGLGAAQRATGQLLACQAMPRTDIAVSRVNMGEPQVCEVLDVARLADDVIRLRTCRPPGFVYRAGQYVTLWRDEESCRAYSLASIPEEEFLEFHVRLYEQGRLSPWLSRLRPGDALALRGPMGCCVYAGEDRQAPLLLVGTGVGLAPLWGILRTALAAGHAGPMHLLHAVREPAQAYLDAELRALAAAHDNVRYRCVGGGLDALAVDMLSLAPGFSGWKVFLCGGQRTVATLRRQLFLAGAASADILADAFLPQAGEPA